MTWDDDLPRRVRDLNDRLEALRVAGTIEPRDQIDSVLVVLMWCVAALALLAVNAWVWSLILGSYT